MPTGDKADKNLKITDFQTRVVNWAIGQIQRDLSNVPAAQRQMTPFVTRAQLDMSPEDLSSLGEAEKSAVKTRRGEITGAALADLFLAYGRNLTSIRNCNFSLRRARTNNSWNPSFPTIASWNNQRTALSVEYAMTPTAFRNAVGNATAPSNPVAELIPGAVNQEAHLDNLITKIRNVIQGNMANTATVNVSVCHSACHSSCHGSRGRR